MSNRFNNTRPSTHRFVLATYLVATTVPYACGWSTAAADEIALNPPPSPAYQWTGCYIGLNLGGGVSAGNFGTTVDPGTYLAPGDAATVSANGGGGANGDGVLAGGQVGCNLQSGILVYGMEGDLDYFRSKPQFNNSTNINTLANGNTFSIFESLTTNFLATARSRIGITAGRNLAYVTGGAAFTSVSYAESYVDANIPAGTGTSTAVKSLTGWTAGGGWEYALADHWTVRAEYLLVNFPTTNANGVITGVGGTNTLHSSAGLVIQLVRAGVSVKF